MRQIKRHPVAGPLYAGLRASSDRSRGDYSLCFYLAFYTAHHWDQYRRLFLKSGLYGDKDHKGYVERTLLKAFVANTANWIEKKRKSRATGARAGRRLAPDTLSVLSMYRKNPGLAATKIANQLGCAAAKVRNILYRLRSGHYAYVFLGVCSPAMQSPVPC